MYNYNISLITGLIAMTVVVASYFLKNKALYLIAQMTGLFFLIFSYLFIEEYFAMIGSAVSVIRVIVYFCLERKEKAPSMLLRSFFGGVAVFIFIILNIIILKNARYLDIIYMVGNILYSFMFGIRDLRLMRYLMLIPTGLLLLYNILAPATLFVIISYFFELSADIAAIIKDFMHHKIMINDANKNIKLKPL